MPSDMALEAYVAQLQEIMVFALEIRVCYEMYRGFDSVKIEGGKWAADYLLRMIRFMGVSLETELGVQLFVQGLETFLHDN